MGQQTAEPMAAPPALFRAASRSAQDVANQRSMHEKYDAMFRQVIEAIEYAFNQYRASASLVDVAIMASIASGGRLEGPALDALILGAPSLAGWTGDKATVREAVAKGMHQQWSAVASRVRVPDLPWYPAFAAFPGPLAPPMPNVPCPFSALAPDLTPIIPLNLRNAMRSCLHGKFDYSDQFFEALAIGFNMTFLIWTGSQMVVNVLGTGPIPTFAPPYVPVGPVVGGRVLRGNHIST